MISTAETEPHLEAALSEAGFRHERPDARLAWRAFREFAGVPVSVAGDALVFECGPETAAGDARFRWTLARDFTHDEADDEPGTERLTLTLFFAADAALHATATRLSSAECASPDEWFARVASLPGFGAVMDRPALGCEVTQADV